MNAYSDWLSMILTYIFEKRIWVLPRDWLIGSFRKYNKDVIYVN